MRRKISKLLHRSGLAIMVLAGALALSVPSPVLAAQRGGGGHGFSGGGHGYSGGARGFSGGQHFSSPAPAYRGGGGNYYRGGGEGYYRGGDRGYYRGGGYYGRGYGYGYGYAAPYLGFGYSYAPSCGYYDSWGRWIPNPGCYVAPYGYGPGY